MSERKRLSGPVNHQTILRRTDGTLTASAAETLRFLRELMCTGDAGTRMRIDEWLQQHLAPHTEWKHEPAAKPAGAATSEDSAGDARPPARIGRALPGAAGITGVFTDGSADPNPGPGGWGVVWVVDGRIVDERNGETPDTTNNRMELQALIEACRMLPADAAVDVVSDSQLCVRTVNEWGPAWRRAGWRRKRGAIANLDLVKELLELAEAHPGCRVKWTRGHAANPCNEYADRLAARRAR